MASNVCDDLALAACSHSPRESTVHHDQPSELASEPELRHVSILSSGSDTIKSLDGVRTTSYGGHISFVHQFRVSTVVPQRRTVHLIPRKPVPLVPRVGPHLVEMSTRRSSQRYVVKGSEDDLVAQGLAVKKGSSPVSATQESTARLWMPTSSLKQVKRRLLVFFKQGPGIGTTSSEVIELLEQPQVKSDSPSSAGQEVYVEDKIAVAQTYGPPRKSSLSGVKELPEDQETSPLPPGKENLPPAKRVPSFLGRHFTPSTHSDAPSSRSSTFGTIQELQSPAHSKPLGRRHGLISPPTVPSRSLSLGVAQKPAVSLGPVRSRSMSITGPRELRRVLANNAEPLYIGTQKQAQYNLFFPPSRHIIRQPPPPCREAVPKTRVTPPPGPTKKRKAQSYGPLRQAGHHAAARPPQIWTPLIFPRSSSTTDQQFSHHVQSHQRTISSTPKPKEPPKLPLFTPSIFLRPATSKYLRSRQRRWDSHSHSHTHTLSISISSTLATRGRSLDADSPTLLLADLDPIALNGLKRLLDRSPTVSWTWGVDDGQRTRVPVQRHAMSVEGGGSEGLGIAFRRHPRRWVRRVLGRWEEWGMGIWYAEG